MKGAPTVAIIGRPNVGKSTLFNRIVGRREAIVDDRPGVTRDRHFSSVEWNGQRFWLVDTGGMTAHAGDPLSRAVRSQVELAVAESDVVLFVVDVEQGVHPGDLEIAEYLRRAERPVILVANKADQLPTDTRHLVFYELGLGDPLPVSAAVGTNSGDLLDRVVEVLGDALPLGASPPGGRSSSPPGGRSSSPPGGRSSSPPGPRSLRETGNDGRGEFPLSGTERGSGGEDDRRPGGEDDRGSGDEYLRGSGGEDLRGSGGEDLSGSGEEDLRGSGDDVAPIRVAVVGRPNVGKSSLVNRLLGEERLVVAPEPGTTRDAIDTSLRYQGRTLVFIDTAGLRKRSKVDDEIEFYATLRTARAIERADVCVLVVDAAEGMPVQDLKIANDAWDQGAALIVAVNKWDLIEEKDANTGVRGERVLKERAPFLQFVPFLYVSAKTGQRVTKLLDLILEVAGEREKRIPTHEVNEVLEGLVRQQQPPQPVGESVRLLYATQIGTAPPRFAVVSNRPEAIPESYTRYLLNGFRAAWRFGGSPVTIKLRRKRERAARG